MLTGLSTSPPGGTRGAEYERRQLSHASCPHTDGPWKESATDYIRSGATAPSYNCRAYLGFGSNDDGDVGGLLDHTTTLDECATACRAMPRARPGQPTGTAL